MATFVEQAVLKLTDQTSKPANKINSALTKLFNTADKLKKLDVKINVRVNGLDRATSQFKAATRAINTYNAALRRAGVGNGRQIAPQINSGQLAALQSLTRSLRAYSAAARAAAGAPAINARVRPGRSPVPGIPQGGAGAVAGRNSVNIHPSSWTPMRSILAGFAADIGRNITHAIISGTKEGLKTSDVADTRIRLQQLDGKTQAAINKTIDKVFADQQKSATGAIFSRGQIASIVSEVIPTVRGDADAIAKLTPMLTQLAAMQIAQGEKTVTAIDNAFKFAKAGEQSGNFTDASGKFDANAATAFFDTLKKVAPDIGREFSGSFVQQAIKYLRTSKLTVDKQGLATALFLNEEMGSTASVGINQAIKQLAGLGTTKKVLANLEQFGFISTKEVKSGKVGKKTRTETVVDKPIDEDTLRQDLLRFITERVIPQMSKEGLNPSNPVDATKMANKISSDRTAVDVISTLINRAAELRIQVDNALKRDVSPDKIDKTLSQSTTLSFESVSNQFEGMLGEMAKSLSVVLNPALQGVSNTISSISALFSGEASGGQKLLAAAGLGATAGVGALGATSLAAFVTAGPALNTAAGNLTLAAGALSRSAVAQGASGIAGGAASAGAGAAAGVGLRMLGGALRFAGWAGVAAFAASIAWDKYQNGFQSDRFLSKPGDKKSIGADERLEIVNSIQKLEKQIAENKAREKLPGTSDVINQPLQTQLAEERQKLRDSDEMIAKWSATWQAGGESINASLVTGAATLSTGLDNGVAAGAAKLAATGAELGATAGQTIAGFGSQLGQAAGAAIAAAIANVSVRANVQAGPNVGTTKTND